MAEPMLIAQNAQTMRPKSGLDIEATITGLAVDEALVSGVLGSLLGGKR